MSRYLLDTNVLIDFSKGVEPVKSRLLEWIDGSEIVAVCPVSVGEFFAGVPPSHAGPWQEFVESLEYWDIPLTAAIRAGSERLQLAKRAVNITIADALVAATARAHRATLVTHDERHFPQDVAIVSLR